MEARLADDLVGGLGGDGFGFVTGHAQPPQQQGAHLLGQADGEGGGRLLRHPDQRQLGHAEHIEHRRLRRRHREPAPGQASGDIVDQALVERRGGRLWPDLAHQVCHIQFEHSPARGDQRFTADGTAFDVFISCRDTDGAKTFIAIEVKYSEAMTEAEARGRERYEELAKVCGLYRDPSDPSLRANPLQQLWREHMLAERLVANGLYDRGVFVCMAPRLNDSVQRACKDYGRKLIELGGACGFNAVTLEEMIGAIRDAGGDEFADALYERYCDFTPVHQLI